MVATLASSLAGLLLGVTAGVLVYFDADKLEMDTPLLWGGLVAGTVGLAMALAPFGLVPAPGMLAMGLLGPAVYVFERDDAREGEDRPDPRTLDGPDPRRESEE